MTKYVGLDVSQEGTVICVLDEARRVAWQGRAATTPEAIAASIARHVGTVAVVGLESGALSNWLWSGLRRLGVPAVCIDARSAHAFLSSQAHKTDWNDARGIAELMRAGWYREVAVKNEEAQLRHALLACRMKLVAMRRDAENQVRGVLRNFGLIAGRGRGRALWARMAALAEQRPELGVMVKPLLSLCQELARRIDGFDRKARRVARQDLAVRRLMTTPGVGPITALAFAAAVGDPARFKRSQDVGVYLGLVPRRLQSGQSDRFGPISKHGDALTRVYLFEAATVLLTRIQRWCALRAWAVRLAARIGSKRARVALARKLATVLLALWRDGTTFRWTKPETTA